MTGPADRVIFKIVTREAWEEARAVGIFKGAPVDLEDGYIHFSTEEQVAATAARHFAGQSDLLLISVSSAAVADNLKYEVSRAGQLFPHLYGDLPLSAVIAEEDLPLGEDGRHRFPERTQSSPSVGDDD